MLSDEQFAHIKWGKHEHSRDLNSTCKSNNLSKLLFSTNERIFYLKWSSSSLKYLTNQLEVHVVHQRNHAMYRNAFA